MMLAYAGAKKRSGVKVSLDLYNGHYYDNMINETAFKVALFQRVQDKRMQAAVEYILEGGDIQDLPMEVVRRLRSILRNVLKEKQY